MTSLSKVFKYSDYSNQAEKRVIEPKVFRAFTIPETNFDLEQPNDVQQPDSPADLELLRAKEEANQLMEQVNQEIALLKENARLEIEEWKKNEQSYMNEESEQLYNKAKEEGFQQGFQSGLVAGTDEGIRRYQDQINHASTIIKQAETDWERRILQSEPFLIDLSIEIAKKVILRELFLDKQTVLQMVKETLKLSSELKEITLSVHPDDYPFIRSRIDELKSLISSQANLVILPDYLITSGGCMIRSSLGTLDARVDTQLEEIKRSLLDAVEGSDVNELETVGEV